MIAAVPAAVAAMRMTPSGVVLHSGRDIYEIQIIAPNVVRVHLRPAGRSTPRTLVVDPHVHFQNASETLQTKELSVKVAGSPPSIEIDDAAGKTMWRQATGALKAGDVTLEGADAGAYFGIENTSLPGNNLDPRQDIREGIYRIGGTVKAGLQGDGGAPLVYTRSYGLLIDSDGGKIDIDGTTIHFHGGSRPDVEYFAIVGPPKATIHAVADISGHPPMMPKWSLGFMNSQWGSTQTEVEEIVGEYRAKSIPLDAFILDFDWKAWGEDNYGEWRWNSTRGPGNVSPNKFPDGASGAFARALRAKGVKLAGIFKPRILLSNKDGTPTQAARYAERHHFFFPWEPAYPEYFSGRNARDIDFSIPAARTWFWQHTLPSYRSGIVAFWNDEADAIGDPQHLFPNLQFLNMERSLYDGARSAGNQRVFSLNRNYYLGAQRYGYAEWSGDLETSFDSMREQAIRMLGTIDLAEPHWSMDTGGFDGHPSPELYARWMQFAALVPIMRVHGTYGEKRQPWVYGPQAEAAAKAAIDLRYSLLPYFYSCEYGAHETGVGIVRPIEWEFPDQDQDSPYQTDEWMDGDALLVAPIFGEGQTHRDVYLPPGEWYDYFRGTHYTGKANIDYQVDAKTWADIPLFVRAGSILASQPVEQWVGQAPVTDVQLDIFPSKDRTTHFTYYDDDGATYAYEKGAYFKQRITASVDANNVRIRAGRPTGTFKPPLQTYTIVVHGIGTANDRFGPETTITKPAGERFEITLPGQLATPAAVPKS